jgi:hypothetical protein
MRMLVPSMRDNSCVATRTRTCHCCCARMRALTALSCACALVALILLLQAVAVYMSVPLVMRSSHSYCHCDQHCCALVCLVGHLTCIVKHARYRVCSTHCVSMRRTCVRCCAVTLVLNAALASLLLLAHTWCKSTLSLRDAMSIASLPLLVASR